MHITSDGVEYYSGQRAAEHEERLFASKHAKGNFDHRANAPTAGNDVPVVIPDPVRYIGLAPDGIEITCPPGKMSDLCTGVTPVEGIS